MVSDRDIMVRVQTGETGLFAELVKRYQGRLLRFAASKLSDQSLAEDIVQEAFLAAFHARSSYSPEFEFSTWIWTITLNLARQRAKKFNTELERNRRYLEQSSAQQITEIQAIEAVIAEETTAQLNWWLSKLPEHQSDAIRLRFFGELPYEEIAQTMQCSVSGAKRRVKTGLIKLAEFAQREID